MSGLVIDVDVAVVGAGPAGTAAALRCRALAPDLQVALVDVATFPRDKVCGDGIGPEGLDVLARLGVDDVVAGTPRLRALRIVAPSGRAVAGTAPRAGVVVRRQVFDARLRERALAAGARPVAHRVRRVTATAGGVVLDEAVRARVVIGADGANSTVARLVRDRPARRDTGLAMRGYAPWPDLDQLTIWFVGDRWPAYAWAFPLGDGTANIGYGPFDATTISSRHDLDETIGTLFSGHPVDPATLAAHHLPLSPARSAFGHGRVLLAGDAANLVHPLTGEGIYYALLSGAMAGAVAARHLSGIDPTPPATVHTRALRARLGGHLRHTDMAAAMLASSLGVEVAVAAAADDPRVLGQLSEFALGTGRIDARMVAALTRAWWRHRPFTDLVRRR